MAQNLGLGYFILFYSLRCSSQPWSRPSEMLSTSNVSIEKAKLQASQARACSFRKPVIDEQ